MRVPVRTGARGQMSGTRKALALVFKFMNFENIIIKDFKAE